MANQQLEYKYIPTSRGGKYLCIDGCMFRSNRKRNASSWILWKCMEKTCSSTVSTVDDIVIKLPGVHNHERVYNDIKMKETLHRLKLKAKTTLTPMPTLYNEEVLAMQRGPWTPESRLEVKTMPTFDTVKNRLYISRRSTFPAIPKSRQDIIITEECKTTDAGEPFVIINDGDADKILGMTTTANLEHLCAADIIYGDGTFYVSHTVFLQLYTIHAMVGNQMFPLVFFLLPNKTADNYPRAFRLLKNAAAERGLVLEPRLVQMDYEAAAKNAVSTVFPNAEWKGCLFHFTQCIWRKAQATGLQSDYNQNIDITRLVRRAAALPLLRVNEVEDVWMDTIGDMLDDPRCHRFADYVTTFWVEGDLPLRSWNHYETTGPRTNNHLEAWQGRLKRIISKAHPNVFEMLSFLKDERKLNEIRIIQYGAGQQQPPKKRKYVTMNTKLGNLKANLQAGELSSLEYTVRCGIPST